MSNLVSFISGGCVGVILFVLAIAGFVVWANWEKDAEDRKKSQPDETCFDSSFPKVDGVD